MNDGCESAQDPVSLAVARQLCDAHAELNPEHATEIWEQEATGRRVARCQGWVKVEATRDDRAFLIALYPNSAEARLPHPPMLTPCRWHLHLLDRDEDEA